MKKRRIFAGFAAAAIAASFMSISAVATPITPAGAGNDYTALTGVSDTTTFDKYLVMKKDASVPAGTVTYTIAADEDVDATDGKMPILAGVNGIKFVKQNSADTVAISGENKVATLTFASSDTAVAEAAADADDTIIWSTEDTSDEKAAVKSVGIDISECSFDEPGIYRWVITEECNIPGVTNDVGKGTEERYLDVYIVDNNGVLEFNSFVIHTTDEAAGRNILESGSYKDAASLGDEDPDETADQKSTGFTNAYETYNLEFGKEVTGNQGSKDKRFAFTVKTENANEATVYQLEGNWTKEPAQTSATVYEAVAMKTANNIESLTGAQLNAGYTFYLRDGEYVKILGLEAVAGDDKVSYEITEAAEEYVSSEGTDKVAVDAQGTEGEADYVAAKLHDDDTDGNIVDKDIYTGFTNNRTGVIPTGVILSVAAPAAVGVGVISLIAALNLRKKREDAEE
ncbi:hypothetical protein [Ruminococcus sp.]|uniref:DUF7601 domain-containing protein n=1 Tax=Ruminococcus sp. TaxID=41978 RepID=UPI0025D840CE|nr:hypothetical protein [Ruminococcus sp.]MBQ8967143.1 hypothetical protein [Ruminococcus sp.]